MAVNGPILVLEDDKEDRELLEGAFKELQTPHERHYFDSGEKFLHFLRNTEQHPFIILSDIRVGATNGLELRDAIQKDEALRKKGIPFIFLCTDSRRKVVEQAYELTVQGFFVKPDTMHMIIDQLKAIIYYWSMCKHPNSA